MKTYTSEDFESFERINGTVICPTGDYSGVKVFEANCKFGEKCKFGDNCEFGERCSFGEWNSFGGSCSFGKRCKFGDNCEFGEECSFGNWNNFGEYCSFEECCKFGKRCIFGGCFEFGKNCEFENNGVAKTTTPFITISGGSTNRISYAFNLENGIFVRSGCFFGTLKQFEDEVIQTYGNDSIRGKTYLMWIEIIKINFEEVQ